MEPPPGVCLVHSAHSMALPLRRMSLNGGFCCACEKTRRGRQKTRPMGTVDPMIGDPFINIFDKIIKRKNKTMLIVISIIMVYHLIITKINDWWPNDLYSLSRNHPRKRFLKVQRGSVAWRGTVAQKMLPESLHVRPFPHPKVSPPKALRLFAYYPYKYLPAISSSHIDTYRISRIGDDVSNTLIHGNSRFRRESIIVVGHFLKVDYSQS